MKNIKFLLLLIIGALLVSCSDPRHVVVDTGENTIYMIFDLGEDGSHSKKYKYFISDGCGGFILYSNNKFEIGDVISFEPNPNSSNSLEKN